MEWRNKGDKKYSSFGEQGDKNESEKNKSSSVRDQQYVSLSCLVQDKALKFVKTVLPQ